RRRDPTSSPGGTTTTPAPGTGPARAALGLAALEASLATSLVPDTPTEQDRPSSSATRLRTAEATSAPEPNRRRAPVTSRKASSKAIPSTRGVKERKTL